MCARFKDAGARAHEQKKIFPGINPGNVYEPRNRRADQPESQGRRKQEPEAGRHPEEPGNLLNAQTESGAGKRTYKELQSFMIILSIIDIVLYSFTDKLSQRQITNTSVFFPFITHSLWIRKADFLIIVIKILSCCSALTISHSITPTMIITYSREIVKKNFKKGLTYSREYGIIRVGEENPRYKKYVPGNISQKGKNMITLKEIRELSCNPAIVARMKRIEEIDANMVYCTTREMTSRQAEIKAISKEIQEILQNHKEV